MSTLAAFLLPEGHVRPAPADLLREVRVLREAAGYAVRAAEDRRAVRGLSWSERARPRADDPVLLVPGFLAGDGTLAPLARSLRQQGFRTYRSRIRANVGCTRRATTALEARLEEISMRRGGRVQVVGHSLGGLLARGLAVRRPDLVSGVVTLGSPLLAPGAHHQTLAVVVDVLNRLSLAGVPGLMARDCVAGRCAADAFAEATRPVPDGVSFTSVWSAGDGVVHPDACRDPAASTVEVAASHLGMAVDPRVRDVVVGALRAVPSG